MTPRNLIEPARLAGEAVLRSQSDDRLIDLVRAGNDRAFEAIVHRYRRPLLHYCGRFLSAPRAEDAVQQTFMNAYRAMKADERRIDLRPWLYRIAHNAALNVLRSSSGAVEEPISEEIDGVERPDQAAERRQSLRDVVAAVQALPPRQRDAIVLHELEGRSYDQIAAELKVSGGAVRQLLSRARTTLRAGATALVSEAAFARLASAGGDPVATRIAEIVAAGGGATVVAKVGAAVVVAGAVAVGATDGPLHVGDRGGRSGVQAQRQAAVLTAHGGGPSLSADGAHPAATVADAAKSSASGDRGRRGESAGKGRRHRRGRGRGRGHGRDDSAGSFTDDHSGGDRSGSGSGDDRGHSGSGSSGSGSDDGGGHSGSGSGSGGSGGSGDDGQSGSGSGGSGDDGALVTQEPDNSGSGSSGSGGDSGSGSNSGSGSGDSVPSMPAPDGGSSGPGSGDAR